jgi:hypothetical protein
MRALVVFESMFGDTQKVAESIASGLRPEMDVVVCEVAAAPSLAEVPIDLLVIGGPTHAFRMSSAETRSAAQKKTEETLVSTTTGIRDWIRSQADHTIRPPAATFDTRFKHSRRLTGSAARNARRKMRKEGFEFIAPAESFFVDGERGPLHPGELDRAFQWGESLAVGLITAR